MMSAMAFGSVVVDSEELFIMLSLLWSMDLRIGEMRRPSGACRRTNSRDVGGK